MEVKIGVQNAARELSIESTQTREDVLDAARDALGKDGGLLVLTDDRGRAVAVPTAKIAYIEFGLEDSPKVGFGY